jgi:hypothetical protein
MSPWMPLATIGVVAAQLTVVSASAQRPAAPPPRPAAPPAASEAPAAVARAFYAFHFAHDMGFTEASVRRRSRWLAPDLLARCRGYFARPETPGDVPPIDGDPFTDSQDYPEGFRVGDATVRGDTALVPVTMTWPGAEARAVTLVLMRGTRGWRIADVRYASGPPLRDLLVSRP